ncbi:MAG: phage tail sheath subtilisin-like domain-containing protein [Anaerolineae bacterium]|nr:phage tail sheath subtilisin-like domain-containing protein [Anaerolineae bacterium]
MAVTPTFPGVYVQEIPSGVRTITGVSTSVAAFVDFFRKGPVNDPVQIFSMGDFERAFGGLDTNSEASYGIQQFFLNGGTEAWVVRVVAGAAAAAAVQIGATVGGASAFVVTAISAGVWGNSLRARIDGSPGAATFDLTVTEYATVAGRTVVVNEERFIGLTTANAAMIVNDDNTGSNLVRLSGVSAKPLENGTVTGAYATPATIAVPADKQMDVTIGATTATATLVFPVGALNVTLRQLALIVQEAIRGAAPADPAFAGAIVSVVESNRLRIVAGATTPASRITFAETGAGTAVADLDLDTVVANAQQYTLGTAAAVASTAQAGGTVGNDGSVPDATALIGSEAAKTGIYALEDVSLFNLLCIPRTSIVGSGANDLSATQANQVMSVAIQYCQRRRAFFVMDTPQGIDDFDEVRNWLDDNSGLSSQYAALYYPRVRIPDPLNEYRLRTVGASGTMAGVMARTDSARGVWKAPAGTEASLRGVTALDDVLTDGQNGALNPLAINCLRTFPIYGTVAWGARTLDGADERGSEYKYVPVRRIANYIEESLFRGTKWVIFEPNDEPLWAQIRLNVTAFMQTLFRQGAFQGQTPREAYFVKCDSETTTQDDINRGVVNLVVGFAPLKPAEFLIISVQQIAGQLEV